MSNKIKPIRVLHKVFKKFGYMMQKKGKYFHVIISNDDIVFSGINDSN